MASFITTTMDPTFPLEILEQVIDWVGERDSGVPYDPTQLDCLRSCALVCKAFRHRSQRLMFSRLDDVNPSGSKGFRQLTRLQEVFHTNPRLLVYVRELSIFFKPIAREQTGTEVIDAFAPPYSTLLRFSNMTWLGIKASHVSGPLDVPVCNNVITTYLSQPTLETFMVGNTIQSMYIIRNHSVKHLIIEDIRASSSRISAIVSPFASLQTINVKNCVVAQEAFFTRYEPWVPPHSLREINVDTDGRNFEGMFLDALFSDLKRLPHGRQYFPGLTTLRVPIRKDEDLERLKSFFRYATSVNDLWITVRTIFSSTTRVLHVLGGAIAESRYPLTHLTIDLQILGDSPDIFLALMCDLTSLFDSLSNSDNILTHITIVIKMALATSQCSFLDGWASIAERLANRIAFAKLRHVDVSIVGKVSHMFVMGRLLQEFDGEEEVQGSLSRMMRKLKKREDVIFKASLSLELAESGHR